MIEQENYLELEIEDLPMTYNREGEMTLADETPRGSLIDVAG